MDNDTAYTKVTDDTGFDYYCPLFAVDRDTRPEARLSEDCVESEVVHRYSGHIRIV